MKEIEHRNLSLLLLEGSLRLSGYDETPRPLHSTLQGLMFEGNLRARIGSMCMVQMEEIFQAGLRIVTTILAPEGASTINHHSLLALMSEPRRVSVPAVNMIFLVGKAVERDPVKCSAAAAAMDQAGTIGVDRSMPSASHWYHSV